MLSCFLFSCAGDHRDLPVLTHSFPTRRSSDLLSALASGEPAQLAVMFSIDAYDLIEQDLIVPFEDIEGVSAEWLDSFYPALMANSRIEGKPWGIPVQRSTIVAYSNKDQFR